MPCLWPNPERGRITAASWAGHDNAVPAPILSGTGSMWMGIFQDEADDLCWAAGLGYGNEWIQRLETPELLFLNTTGSTVTAEAARCE